ncbi:MAG TPA: DHA2 family efflux MFS transporter permease subunit [Acidimicrobiales bacterium]
MDNELVYRRRWLILAVLSVSVFLVVVDNTIVNVALPTLNSELDASVSELQWIVDAYSLVFAGLLLAAGGFGDRVGRKGAMQVGLVIFGVMSALAAFASSSGQLIAARGAMGIGAALVFPATLAILTNVFTEPAERAKAIGAWSAVSGLAVAVGPVTGGFLLEHFWWGSVFFVNVPIVVFALVAGWLIIPSSKDPDSGRFDVLGTLLSIGGVGLLVFTVIEGPRWGWGSTSTMLGFAGSALLLVGFVLWELRVTHPLLDVRVFKIARFSAAAGAISVSSFAMFGFVFLATQYFQFVLGYSTLSAGLHTAPFAVFVGVTAPLGARLALTYGPRRVVSSGLGLMSLGLVIASQLTADSAYVGPVLISMAVIAIGLSLVFAPATEAVMGALPKEKAGAGAAVNDTTRELGGTLGVAVIGSVFASVYGPQVVDALRQFPVPADAVEAARESMGAALQITAAAPDGVRESLQGVASGAFIDGMSVGYLVAAGVALAGAVVTAIFLPGRAHAEAAAAERAAAAEVAGVSGIEPAIEPA